VSELASRAASGASEGQGGCEDQRHRTGNSQRSPQGRLHRDPQFVGHGIGRELHEMPDSILNYYDPRDSRLLTNLLVLAVETFVSDGAEFVEESDDGWGLLLPEHHYAAQFEHTIVITKGMPLILTAV